MAEQKLGTYQMLWDCPNCGTAKLLGVDHRHCPSCGSAQDPTKRYFPSEEDKVAVADHRYTGADKRCGACDTPNAALATHCVNCGAPLDDAKEVVKAAARASAAAASSTIDAAAKAARNAPPPEPPKKSGWLGKGCAVGCAMLVLVGVLFAVITALWKQDAALAVTGHSWERTIDIEEYGPVSAEAWCDSVPSGADITGRHQEVRSHNKVSDGQECHNEQHDNGDGTFSEVQKCSDKTRDEPVYDDKCTYTTDQWKKKDSVSSKGSSLKQQPDWPSVSLGRQGTCIGCQREGAHHETYTVSFKDSKDTYTCNLSQKQWSSMADGSKWKGEVRVVTGGLDCDSLKAAR